MNFKESKRIFFQTLTFIGTTILACGTAIAAIEIDQQPLLVARPVPGNMAIVGSLEFPTMVSKANNTCKTRCKLDTNYEPTSTSYVGYFDNNKCYTYIWNETESERHFSPIGPSINGQCSMELSWSGKFLNWSTTQAIDNFRSVLTGGYRVKDTETETWLEKAWQDGQGSEENFPNGLLKNTHVGGATPFTKWMSFHSGVIKRGNQLVFRRSDAALGNPIPFNPADIASINKNDNSQTYQVSVRVKVCVSDMREPNCVKYGDNYKPEGLIQANADNMRYSAFGYLGDGSSIGADGDINRQHDGGVMRARMKFVGEYAVDPKEGEITNTHKEWNPSTGQIIKAPDPDDQAATSGWTKQEVNYSGVINFINRSGQNFPEAKYKRRDNVSELYYSATRYFRNKGNYPSYTDIEAAVAPTPPNRRELKRKQLVDGLPVIKNWDDPIQYSCQKNFILGIGDTNTADDKNLPGAPSSRVNDDSPVNVVDLTNKVYAIEGIKQPSNFNGAESSPYMAGLAYHANATDIRDDIKGKQSISTYWIDIVEFGDLKGRANNQYWLAAKYGGFRVPEDYKLGDPIQKAWWNTNNQPLAHNYPRADNFYLVSNAGQMRTSLTQAFTDIQREQRGSRSSLAMNTNELHTDALTFQTRYTSGSWAGDLIAYRIDGTAGTLSAYPAWEAEAQLPKWDSRKIYVNDNGLKEFKNIGKNLTGDADLAQYLLGKRDKELDGSFRPRQGVLGDFVNSQPVYVGLPNPLLFRNRSFTGSNSYSAWANGLSRDPVVYAGSNDGMLHGFNALTGVETFAFIPATVVTNGLSELADKNYEHRYFVDGEITVADVYIGGSWKTILVGTLGAGGLAKNRKDTNNAIFALDITNPYNVSLLWEKSSADISALGINLGKPVIIQDQNSNWKVTLGNGPNSSTGKAHLISINLADGTVSAPQLSNVANNGLSAVRAWDQDGDGRTDTLYAGDLQGALWKITNLTAVHPTITKLFTATDPSGAPQPITSTPLAGKSPYDRTTWLFFGTGLYLSTNDLLNKQVQSWYGIKDDGTAGHARADLLERKILREVSVTTDSGTRAARVIEEGAREDLANKKGWHIDLYRVQNGSEQALGERMITPNQFQGSALISNTRIPDASDPCAPSGVGMVMSINPFTGARLSDTYFDVNNDQNFNQSDLVVIDGVPTVVSGIGFETGFSNPSFLGDKMYVPTDEGTIKEVGVKPYASIVGRTSWRELINMGD